MLTIKTKPKKKAATKLASQHPHVCAHCGDIWECLQGTKCQVQKAAKVNKQGPWCAFCMSAIMVEHVIALKQWWHMAPIMESLYAAINCQPHLLTKAYMKGRLSSPPSTHPIV